MVTWKSRSRELHIETDTKRKRKRNKTVMKKQMQREAEMHRGMKDSALTEFFAGLLGSLCHLGKSCKAPGLWESGHSRL